MRHALHALTGVLIFFLAGCKSDSKEITQPEDPIEILPEIPKEKVVASFYFNESFAADIGNGLILEPFGNPSFSKDRYGFPNSALLLNGSEDYLYHQRDSAFLPDSEFTICVWIYNDGIDDEEDVIISTLDWPDKGGYQLELNKQLNAIVFDVRGTSKYYISAPYIKEWKSRWIMITARFSVKEISIIVNDKIEAEKKGVFDIHYNGSNNFRIGTNPHHEDSRRRFKGKIDDIMIFNRYLNLLEVKSVYFETKY